MAAADWERMGEGIEPMTTMTSIPLLQRNLTRSRFARRSVAWAPVFLALFASIAIPAAAGAATAESTPITRGRDEHRLLRAAVNDVLAENISAALAKVKSGLAVDEAGDAKLARRIFIVAAWLRNRSAYRESYAFATRAYERELLPKDRLPASAEKAQSLYWRAKIASEIFSRRKEALDLVTAADALNPDSDKVMELRLRLVEAAISFPEN